MKRFSFCLSINILVHCLLLIPVTAQPIPADFIEELWYKNDLIYNVDVKVFKDSDGDGKGDFKGITQELDYLKNLGVDVIWLSPFQPSPKKDDGYDISDFYGIDPIVGTRQDFDEFMQQAKKRGLRVIMDLVPNHTSDQHPWFQQARKDKNSPYRSWYVWSPKRPAYWDQGMVFPGVQKSIWSYDKQAGEYYYHRFYEFQPDLNSQNPAVQAEIRKIIKHWLDAGMSGFRLDAVPFAIEVAKPGQKNFERQFELIDQMHQFIQWHKSDAIILGEANVKPKENKQFFGEQGGGMQMMFNFFANQHLFYALATGDVKPLASALEKTKTIPATAQWAQFLRNHDEVDLGRLGNKDRQKVYDKFGPDTSMQLYGRGIRRRLAPMLGNRALIDLAYSLLFSLPGTPVIRYGEEIGMGDDLSLQERESVRTPMQWSDARQAGFSSAAKTIRPVISKGEYSYTKINVADQRKDPNSLYNRIAGFIRMRKQCPEVGLGNWTLLRSGSPQVLAIRYEWRGRSVVMVHNFSPEAQQIQLDTESAPAPTLHNLLDKTESKANNRGVHTIQLKGYGYGWYRAGTGPSGNEAPGKSTANR